MSLWIGSHSVPATSIRQQVRYSIGDTPTVSLNLSAKVDRDMAALHLGQTAAMSSDTRFFVHGVDRRTKNGSTEKSP
jgi:hypothetical protein